MKAFLYILGLIIIFISPFLGETQINIKDIFEFSNSSNMVFWDLRVARVILGFFCWWNFSFKWIDFSNYF